MRQEVLAARNGLRGEITVPGDKSVSHRAFLINALGSGQARIRGTLDSEDVAASRQLVQALGIKLQQQGKDWILTGASLSEPEDVLDCGNSGTTMRLSAGLLAHQPGIAVLTGDASLRRRPMGRVITPLHNMGLRVDGRSANALAPLIVHGGRPHWADHQLNIASAQVKSAILLAGIRSGVRIHQPRQSRDHTERMLSCMGADISVQGSAVELRPHALHAVDVDVPGDLSSAAFWLVAASIVPGSEVLLHGVGMNPTRRGVLGALREMGGALEVFDHTGEVEPRATLRAVHTGLHGATISGQLTLDALDELPILAVAAVMAHGETHIEDAEELRHKESDRIARVVNGLRAMGAQVEERPDGMVLAGGGFRGPQATIDAHGDHRIAMAFAIAGLCAPKGVLIENADSVNTSYPDFFNILRTLQRR